MVSMVIDRRYEEQIGRQFFWIIWYPLVFWMIGMVTTVVALPKGTGAGDQDPGDMGKSGSGYPMIRALSPLIISRPERQSDVAARDLWCAHCDRMGAVALSLAAARSRASCGLLVSAGPTSRCSEGAAASAYGSFMDTAAVIVTVAYWSSITTFVMREEPRGAGKAVSKTAMGRSLA